MMSSKLVKNRGFTLIELLVTITIFVFMTALVLAKYKQFYNGTVFRNLAYDVALTIRQAQTYGISVKVDESVSDDYNKAYGVFFDITNSVTNTAFQLNRYNGTVLSGLEKNYKLKNKAIITNLYVGQDFISRMMMRKVKIIYKRPNPEAIICGTDLFGVEACNHKYAMIILRTGDASNTYKIEVFQTGQISLVP